MTALQGNDEVPKKRMLPGSLAANPRLDRWVRIGPSGTVTVFSGKVELGQGITTALAQIAADELDVALERIVMVRSDTAQSPDEGVTSGSRSIEESGLALRYACAEARAILLQQAAQKFAVTAEQLTVDDGIISVRGAGSVSYWDLASPELLAREATAEVQPKPAAEHKLIGTAIARLDLPAKLSGAAYVHDMDLPGMLYGRVLRPPSYRARLQSCDEAALRALPGLAALVRDGNFLALAAEREEQAIKGLQAAARFSVWQEQADLPDPADLYAELKRLPARFEVINEKTDAAARGRAAKTLQAHYTRPYIAHASIGPSCAVAQMQDGRLHVWSHSQGIFLLRTDLAKALGIAEDRITVTHMDGAGCYGHNGADDAALDAALLARACGGRPVKLQWMREDEFAWEPYGPAMLVELEAALDAQGNIVDWRHEQWSNPHSMRAGRSDACGLLASWHLAEPSAVPPALDMPQPGGGSDRNAVPMYQFPNQRIAKHLITEMPLRVSALRALGGYINVFAGECFIDELAAAAGADPVEYRLRHLNDARARAVIEAAASRAGWLSGAPGGNGSGRGIGLTRYKTVGTYCAVVAEIEVEREIRVKRCVAAVDCGMVINPDGVINQIEGGIIQSLSWTLKEQVRFDRQHILSRTWEDYPILTFSEVPKVEVVLLDRPEEISKGAGEAAQGPTAAAIGNALAHAVGVRVRALPFTRERLVAELQS